MIAARPDYLLAGFPDLQTALADPRVRARLERLRQVYPSTRVRWLLRRGAADVLPKPFAIATLLAVLERLPPRSTLTDLAAAETAELPRLPKPPRPS